MLVVAQEVVHVPRIRGVHQIVGLDGILRVPKSVQAEEDRHPDALVTGSDQVLQETALGFVEDFRGISAFNGAVGDLGQVMRG